MDRIFGHCGQWSLHHGRTTVEVEINKDDGGFSFEIPWGFNKKMQIFLQTYDKTKREIQGIFKVIDGDLSGKIDFVVKEQKLLEETFDHYVCIQTWSLYRGKIEH